MKSYVIIKGFHFGVVLQWRWRPSFTSCCHYHCWGQWLCFEFARDRTEHG